MYYCSEYDSPLGRLTLASDGEAICGLWIEGQRYHGLEFKGASIPGAMKRNDDAGGFDELRAWLERYFEREFPSGPDAADAAMSHAVSAPSAGCASASGADSIRAYTSFAASSPDSDNASDANTETLGQTSDFPVVFEGVPLAPMGSPFRRAVWRRLLAIPYGRLTTYGAISKDVASELGRSSALAVGGAVGHNPISIIIPCHRVVGSDGSLTGYAGGLDKKEWLLAHEGIDVDREKVSRGLLYPR